MYTREYSGRENTSANENGNWIRNKTYWGENSQVIKISWPSAYQVVQITIYDKYNLWRQHISDSLYGETASIILPGEGSYKIEIDYLHSWASDLKTYNLTLYYKYSQNSGDSGIVNENWTPTCNHDFSGVSPSLLYEGSTKILTYNMQGEYTMIVKSKYETNILFEKNISHTGLITTGQISLSEYNPSNDIEVRLYSKECIVGPHSCSDYRRFLVPAAAPAYQDTYWWMTPPNY